MLAEAVKIPDKPLFLAYSLEHLFAHIELRRIFQFGSIQRYNNMLLYRVNEELRAVVEMDGNQRSGDIAIFYPNPLPQRLWLRGVYEKDKLIEPLRQF